MPGNAGSRAGWVLIVRPPNRARKSGPTSFMNPALITRSGSYAATRSARAASQPARSDGSTRGWTKVLTPAAAARSRPTTPGRSEPTATTLAPYVGSAPASSRAWSSAPVPDSRTTSRAGDLRPGSGWTGSGTAATLPRALGDLLRLPQDLGGLDV